MSVFCSDIGGRFVGIAADAFSFSFDDYSRRTNGRVLYGLLIDTDVNRLEALFGDPPQALMHAVNGRPIIDSKAGYRVDVAAVFPDVGVNADVLLLSKVALEFPRRALDALLLHEACHLVIDSGSLGYIAAMDAKAAYYGDKLYKKTDTENERITKHTPEFCRILAGGAERLRLARPDVFADRWDALLESMQFDLRAR
jgi:hypothetical protein